MYMETRQRGPSPMMCSCSCCPISSLSIVITTSLVSVKKCSTKKTARAQLTAASFHEQKYVYIYIYTKQCTYVHMCTRVCHLFFNREIIHSYMCMYDVHAPRGMEWIGLDCAAGLGKRVHVRERVRFVFSLEHSTAHVFHHLFTKFPFIAPRSERGYIVLTELSRFNHKYQLG